MKLITVAVDASRVRSGGGIAHILGILDVDTVESYGISEIHIWGHKSLLELLPDRIWLIKHKPAESESSLFAQLYWQATKLADEIKQVGCDVLFSADASTLCRFKPMVVLSQNMLPYENGIMQLYGLSKDRLRQAVIQFVQKQAFRVSDASIFLTNHAAERIQAYCGVIKNKIVIPHGVHQQFKNTRLKNTWPPRSERPLRCIYVSPILEYKYQWVVVRALKRLRDKGYSINLMLVGGGARRAKHILSKQIEQSDPKRQFVEVLDFVPHSEIADRIAEADIFIFASGCETFGISLLEAMAVGIPIASSDRSSLPETLRDGGVYFDPADEVSVSNAVEELIVNDMTRNRVSTKARALAEAYSWRRCADQTWMYIVQTYRRSLERI